MVAQLARVQAGDFDDPELQAARPLLELQALWSALPSPDTLLAEVMTSREGTHLFLYPFAGRHAHLGLANLIAWRVAQHAPNTFSIAVNDYGFELLSATAIDWPSMLPGLLKEQTDDDALLSEILQSLNASELAQRRFREIARVSGLVFQGHPGEKRSSRQLQASQQPVLGGVQQVRPRQPPAAAGRSRAAGAGAGDRPPARGAAPHGAAGAGAEGSGAAQHRLPSPLMVERLREKLSNESVADRIARMLAQLEKAAGGHADSDPEQVRGSLAFGRESAPDKPPAATKRARRPHRPRRPL